MRQGSLSQRKFGEVLGAKEESKSSKVRDSGEYDRKSFRITIPILSRNCQIIVEEILTVFHFPLQHWGVQNLDQWIGDV